MIRHEEALGRKLRVALGRREGPPKILAPEGGQAYFKLLPDALRDVAPGAERAALDEFLLRARAALLFPVGAGERAAFLEHLLEQAYRRERAAHFGGDDEAESAQVVGFPTLHFARKAELGTLLRFPITPPEWLDEAGVAWSIPRYRRRRRGGRLSPPAQIRLVEAPPAEDDDLVPLPYALDINLLSRTLGVPEEHVTRLLAQLTKRDGLTPGAMIAALTALLTSPDDDYPDDLVTAALDGALDPDDPPSASPSERLAALYGAVAGRLLPRGVRVYPLALTWDASQAMTTHGLQRDLRALASAPPPRRPESALGAYLLGLAPPSAQGVHLGARGPHAPTAEQRAIADRALGQRLVCAQGPPGTGKTALILDLAAHTIIDRLARASTTLPPTLPLRAPLVVTSTNNRAVDNVTDPLSRELPPERLPLALRLGSRAVMQEITQPTLERTLAWLERGDPGRAEARWEGLRRRLVDLHRPLRALVTEVRAASAAAAALPELRRRREALAGRLGVLEGSLSALSPERLAEAREAQEAIADWSRAVRRAIERLDRGGRLGPTKAARLWKRANKSHSARARAALEALGLSPPKPRRPRGSRADEADWRRAFEALWEHVESLPVELWRALGGEGLGAKELADLASAAELVAEREALDEELARLEGLSASTGEEPLDPRAASPAIEGELFALACEAREAWALMHRDRLRALLKELIGPRKGRRALWLLPSDDATRRELFELFPVVGSTLLSLGNAFPLEPDAISEVVIDEAGQCHPAYAVSALARAERALVIGDPYQLEPVIGLDDAEERRVLRRISSPLSAESLAPFRATDSAGRSAHTLAARACGEVLALRDHFRCQPAIIRISDTLCGYGLRVKTPPASLAGRSRHLPGPLSLHDIRGSQSPRAGSWANEAEVERVARLTRALLDDGLSPAQIGVLTPYRGQLAALRARLRQVGVPLDDSLEIELQGQLFGEPAPGAVALGTVHRFQGGERDVIILSTVVTRERSLGFTNRKVNLINVAVSRAKQHLIIVGDGEALARGAVTRVLLRAVPERHRIGPRG